MSIIDTNVLLRSIVRDDPKQAAIADQALKSAERIILSLQMLCELIWVLTRTYRRPREAVVATIRELMQTANVIADREAVAAGLSLMEAGSDFADGVIAHEGRRLGGEIFVTFDQRAAQQLATAGAAVELLA